MRVFVIRTYSNSTLKKIILGPVTPDLRKFLIQCPDKLTVQTLYTSPLPDQSIEQHLDMSGNLSATLHVMRENYSYTIYPPRL